MGTIIEALCECGYNKRMFLGGGFRDFTERNAFPYLCNECSDIVVLNAMDSNPCCDQCQGTSVTSYSDPSIFLDQPLSRAVHKWENYPSSEILRAQSANAYIDVTVRMFLGDDVAERDKFLSEIGSNGVGVREELVAEYEATWEKIRAGKYVTLYDCGYPCPSCGRMTLHFENAGRWD